MTILTNTQIEAKIKRIAYQILELYIGEESLYLAGINNNGSRMRDELYKALKQIHPTCKIYSHTLSINPADPISREIDIDIDLQKLTNENVVIIDDVANTGRTLFYASTIFKDTLVKSIRTCVLVDRQHKSFPVHVDFVGLSLATTINENILVDLTPKSKWSAQIV